jgi:hypothetical protein
MSPANSEDDAAERSLEEAKATLVERMSQMIEDLEWTREHATIRNDDWLEIADALRALKTAVKRALERSQ